jgi:hypothetical protein
MPLGIGLINKKQSNSRELANQHSSFVKATSHKGVWFKKSEQIVTRIS